MPRPGPRNAGCPPSLHATARTAAQAEAPAVNLPALTVSVGDMAAALEQVAGPEVSALIDWVPDPAVAAMFATWPGRVHSERAAKLGLTPDPDFVSIISLHRAESATGR
jgi:hypothetical protein